MHNFHQKALSYTGALLLLILSVLAITTTVFMVNGNQAHDENTISVTGTAEVSAAPDVANFSFTVTETAPDANTAQETINKKISTILDGLTKLNVDEKDIKTESYTIYPKYEYVRVTDNEVKIALSGESYIPEQQNKQVQVGFDVSQNVQVTLRNLESVPETLTLFAQNGVENLSGPNFEIDDPEALKEQARLAAIAEAKEKAKRLASDLDVKLGKIVSFYEDAYNPMPYNDEFSMMAKGVAMDMAQSSFEPELPMGENDITATVTLTYKIR
jgi:uncharacterized protein YggE